MQTQTAAGKGNGGTLSAVREACAELLNGAFAARIGAEEVSMPHRLADAGVSLAKLGGMAEEPERRILAAPAPKRLGTEVFAEVRFGGKTVLFTVSDAFLEKAASEKAKTLPEPVLPPEIAVPAAGAAPDEGALAYALALAVCAHRSGRPYRPHEAHKALLSCLMLADAPNDRALQAGAVRAVLKAFEKGLFGGEPVLFMAKALSRCGE